VGGSPAVALDVAVAVAEVVGGALALLVPDGAGIEASFGPSEGFPPPEHPAARIIKQTKNLIRMARAYQEKWLCVIFLPI